MSATSARCIGFDVGDTLLEYAGIPLSWESYYPEALNALANAWGVRPAAGQMAEADACLKRFNTRIHPRVAEVRFEEIATRIANIFGFDGRWNEAEAARVFFSVFQQSLRCFPDTLRTLDRLTAAGDRIGLFSDVPYGMPTELVVQDLRSAGLASFADNLLTSREVGFRKPSIQTLQALAQRLNCEPTEMSYVGNERKDVEAARAIGCRAVLLRRRGDSVDWGQDVTIQSLDELV